MARTDCPLVRLRSGGRCAELPREAEVLAMFHPREEIRSVLHDFEDRIIYGGMEDLGLRFGTEIQREFGALNGLMNLAGKFGSKIVPDHVDGGGFGSAGGFVLSAEEQFEMGDFDRVLFEERLNAGGEII